MRSITGIKIRLITAPKIHRIHLFHSIFRWPRGFDSLQIILARRVSTRGSGHHRARALCPSRHIRRPRSGARPRLGSVACRGRNLHSIQPPVRMASRYRDAKRGQSRPSNRPLESRAAHVPSDRGPWRLGQGERGPLSSIKRSRAARTMHSLQTLQGIKQRQINRDSRALREGASAPFSFALAKIIE